MFNNNHVIPEITMDKNFVDVKSEVLVIKDSIFIDHNLTFFSCLANFILINRFSLCIFFEYSFPNFVIYLLVVYLFILVSDNFRKLIWEQYYFILLQYLCLYI